ncbi:MAG: HipA N-terminal domain-containing protein [Saprospiraceae bacterium]
MRSAKVLLHEQPVGSVWENEEGFFFQYAPEYAARADARPVSLTLPVRVENYSSDAILPFFDGLIPEGWLLQIAENHWKIGARDRVGLLFACCRDCIGAVSIQPDSGP